jgi:hypothetical protein
MSAREGPTRFLHVLCFREDPSEWVAQCLDIDVVAQGGSPKAALQAFCEHLLLSKHWGFDDLPGEDVPGYYWELAAKVRAWVRHPMPDEGLTPFIVLCGTLL